MKKELLLLIYVLTISLLSFGQSNSENKNQETQSNINKLDTSVFAIIPFNTNLHWIFKNNAATDLTIDDIHKIETILAKCINDYNPEQEKQFKELTEKRPEYKLNKEYFIIDLNRYKRQYVPTINSKGEKEIWINCFCKSGNLNWRTQTIFVRGGGNSYFNLKVNLTTGQYYELIVNGDE